MQVAVLSDIHGNYIALQECLRHAEEQKVDAYLFLGDYLGEFPNPQKTMKMLYALREKYDCYFIRGNKEDYWINYRKGTSCDWTNGNHGIGAMKYCFENLVPEDIDFFESLPIKQKVCFENYEPILICHGTPADNRGTIPLEEENIQKVLGEYSERYIVCGHTHEKRAILSADKIILNAGSVGIPLHEKRKTQYMLLSSEGREWKYRFICLNYDVDAVVREIHESGLAARAPYWCKITEHLLYTGEISHGAALYEVMRLNEYRDAWYNIEEKYWEKALKTLGMQSESIPSMK